MNDKQMAALFRTEVLPRMAAQPDLAGVELARKYQPRQQGAATGPIVYFFKIGDHRYGSTKREHLYNEAGVVFDSTDRQQYETTYQFAAWVPQRPQDVAALTESDVLNIVSAIMQSDALIAAFRAAGVGIQRVTDVRNPYFVDERDRFEAEPSFDIVLTHYRNLSSTLPGVDTYEANIYRV